MRHIRSVRSAFYGFVVMFCTAVMVLVAGIALAINYDAGETVRLTEHAPSGTYINFYDTDGNWYNTDIPIQKTFAYSLDNSNVDNIHLLLSLNLNKGESKSIELQPLNSSYNFLRLADSCNSVPKGQENGAYGLTCKNRQNGYYGGLTATPDVRGGGNTRIIVKLANNYYDGQTFLSDIQYQLNKQALQQYFNAHPNVDYITARYAVNVDGKTYKMSDSSSLTPSIIAVTFSRHNPAFYQINGNSNIDVTSVLTPSADGKAAGMLDVPIAFNGTNDPRNGVPQIPQAKNMPIHVQLKPQDSRSPYANVVSIGDSHSSDMCNDHSADYVVCKGDNNRKTDFMPWSLSATANTVIANPVVQSSWGSDSLSLFKAPLVVDPRLYEQYLQSNPDEPLQVKYDVMVDGAKRGTYTFNISNSIPTIKEKILVNGASQDENSIPIVKGQNPPSVALQLQYDCDNKAGKPCLKMGSSAEYSVKPVDSSIPNFLTLQTNRSQCSWDSICAGDKNKKLYLSKGSQYVLFYGSSLDDNISVKLSAPTEYSYSIVSNNKYNLQYEINKTLVDQYFAAHPREKTITIPYAVYLNGFPTSKHFNVILTRDAADTSQYGTVNFAKSYGSNDNQRYVNDSYSSCPDASSLSCDVQTVQSDAVTLPTPYLTVHLSYKPGDQKPIVKGSQYQVQLVPTDSQKDFLKVGTYSNETLNGPIIPQGIPDYTVGTASFDRETKSFTVTFAKQRPDQKWNATAGIPLFLDADAIRDYFKKHPQEKEVTISYDVNVNGEQNKNAPQRLVVTIKKKLFIPPSEPSNKKWQIQDMNQDGTITFNYKVQSSLGPHNEYVIYDTPGQNLAYQSGTLQLQEITPSGNFVGNSLPQYSSTDNPRAYINLTKERARQDGATVSDEELYNIPTSQEARDNDTQMFVYDIYYDLSSVGDKGVPMPKTAVAKPDLYNVGAAVGTMQEQPIIFCTVKTGAPIPEQCKAKYNELKAKNKLGKGVKVRLLNWKSSLNADRDPSSSPDRYISGFALIYNNKVLDVDKAKKDPVTPFVNKATYYGQEYTPHSNHTSGTPGDHHDGTPGNPGSSSSTTNPTDPSHSTGDATGTGEGNTPGGTPGLPYTEDVPPSNTPFNPGSNSNDPKIRWENPSAATSAVDHVPEDFDPDKPLSTLHTTGVFDTSLRFSKVDGNNDNTPLAGAVFRLCKATLNSGTKELSPASMRCDEPITNITNEQWQNRRLQSNSGGLIVDASGNYPVVSPGDYVLEEITPPFGFKGLDGRTIQSPDGYSSVGYVPVHIPNGEDNGQQRSMGMPIANYRSSTTVKIKKIEGGTVDTPLKGSLFEFYRFDSNNNTGGLDGSPIAPNGFFAGDCSTKVDKAQASCFSFEVPVGGDLWVKETQIPHGHYVFGAPTAVSISENGFTIKRGARSYCYHNGQYCAPMNSLVQVDPQHPDILLVSNYPVGDLPKAGGNGLEVSMLLGMALCIAGFIFQRRSRLF